MAVVHLPHAERLAGVERHADLLAVRGAAGPDAPRGLADVVLGGVAHAREDAGLVAALLQIGGRLVVRRREVLLRRQVVDVVLAVVEHLLEAVSVAGGIRGGALRHVHEEVGRHVVERTALEAAVAVEHEQRLVFDVARRVRARREHRRVVHEVVGGGEHERERAVDALPVRQALQPKRVGQVAEAARIDVPRVEHDRVDERLVGDVGDLHEVGDDLVGTLQLQLLPGLQHGALREGTARRLEVGRRGQHGEVHDVEHAVRVELGRHVLRPVRHRASADLQRAVHAPHGERPRRARNPADAAAGDAVERAVEREQRARGRIAGERARRREVARVPAAGGHAQQVRRALEERPIGIRLRVGARALPRRPEVELQRVLVVRNLDLLVGEVERLPVRNRHRQRAAAVHEHLRHAARRPLHGEMAPAAGRQLARRRSRILRLEHVHEHQLQLARIGTVGELQHRALPGLALVRAEALVRLEQHDRTADVLAVRAGNGRLPVALEPGLHRPRAGGEEQPILAPQLEPGRPAGHGARLVPERPLVRSAQTDGAVARLAGDAGGEVRVRVLRERQLLGGTQREAVQFQLRERARGFGARQAVLVVFLFGSPQAEEETQRARLGMDATALREAARLVGRHHERRPAPVVDGLGQPVAGRVALLHVHPEDPARAADAFGDRLELDGASGQSGRHGDVVGGFRASAGARTE